MEFKPRTVSGVLMISRPGVTEARLAAAITGFAG